MGIAIRAAAPEDVDNIYSLSNDPEIRGLSYRQDHIAYEDHVQWFSEKLKDDACVFLVVWDGPEFIGQVRFQRAENGAKISISIMKKYRNLGVGKIVMDLAVGYLLSHSAIHTIRALVKKSNSASMRFFEKCGYYRVKDLSIHGVPSVEYILQIS
jgi:RimJ/RimL family protein N-acetyltransferase